MENYWLMASTDAEDPSKSPEFVMFSDSLPKVEALLSAIVTSSMDPSYFHRFKESFDGYANSAQTDYDPATSAECVEGMDCKVSAGPNGFFLTMASGYRIVTSITARLDSDGIRETVAMVEGLREWSRASLDEIESRRKDSAPSP